MGAGEKSPAPPQNENMNNEWSRFYKKYLLDRIGEEAIFKHYLDRDPDYKGQVTNPLRNDKHPGCTFARSQKTGRLYFYDYAKEKTYDCFAVVMEKYGISFWQAIRLIEKDFKVELNTAKVEEAVEKQKDIKRVREVTFEEQDFTPEDLEYWNQYGITKELLLHYGIQSVKTVYINGKLRWEYAEGNPIYRLPYGLPAAKYYRPRETRKSSRWLSFAKREDAAFYDRLPFLGDTLIITKSAKDALVLLSLGYTSTAPSSETVRINTPKFRALLMTHDQAFLLYDNDEVGIRSSELRSKELDIPYLLIPKKYGVKDISDFHAKYGREATKELIDKMIANGKYHHYPSGGETSLSDVISGEDGANT